MSGYSSSTDPRSPPFGTATFSSFTNSQSIFSPSRYSYASSDTPLASSDSEGATSDRRMRRVNVSPTRSGNSYDSYSEENSIEERAEVEVALTDLDNELDSTEDMLTEWSRGSGPSYTGTTPSYSTSLDTYSIYNREGNRLSTISERTENVPSRPISYLRDGSRSANPTPEGPRLSAHRISTASPGHLHTRSVTDLTSDRPTGRRTGDLIAFFEDRAAPADSSFSHSRTSSMPGNRVHSPFYPHSQSTPYMSSTTGYGYTTTGYGSSTGYGSRPSSPAKSKAGSTVSSASDALSSSSLLAPPTRGLTTATGRSGTQLSPSDFASTFSNTFAEARSTPSSPAISPTVSSLRRPQTSPRSPLTSVRNIVAAWKERTPALGKAQSSTESSVSPIVKPVFGLRRRSSRVERGQHPASENTGSGHNPPTTPKSVNSNIIPPPFDMTELGAYARESREPLRKGDLWYLNVHSGPPYRWQRCEALLYPHMLLLSWIAPGGGRGVVTLDLLNCTEVRSVPSLNHPSAKEDVGTIAARAQIAEGNCPPLMELVCPFQLLYSDGVERLAAESARERVRWVGAIWEALDRSVTLPSRSEPGSPTGSIRTINTMTSTTSVSGTGSGSASTVFVPPLHTIPSLSDLHTLSDSLSTGSLSCPPLFPLHHTRTTDNGAVSNQSYIYPGDPRVIAPSRSSSLRRTSSLMDLDGEFASAVSRARNAKPGLGFGLSLVGGVILGDGSPVTVSSGPRLSGEVRVTPPPSGKTKTRPLSDISDDNFFSAGSRTSSSEPRTTTNSFYTMSNSSTSSSDARPTTTDIITDETAFEFTSGDSNTQIVPSTLSYRRTESNSYLGDSHDGSYTYSSYTSSSPSSLSRSSGIRRTRYSRTYISDKENATSGYTASQSRSTLSTWTRSRSTTPTPAPSAAALSALDFPDGLGSEGYKTANSPLTASFKAPTPPSQSPTEAALLQSPELDIHLEITDITPESVPLPPLEISPTMLSASRDLESEHFKALIVPPLSIVSSGELSFSLPPTVESSSEDESSRMPTVSSTESSEFVMRDLPVSEEGLSSPGPLATTESSPSVHASHWASETDISYESSQLLPTPLTQSIQFQDGRDTSIDTSFMHPSVSPLTSLGSLTAMTETITTSVVSTPIPPPPPPPALPPPPPPAPVAQSVSSPSSGPTPLSLTSTASSSLSRTPSSVSSVSSLSSRISLAEDDDVLSLADAPARSEVSTEPSLLSSLRSSSISPVHYSPQPTRVPPPESSVTDHSPDHSSPPSPSVSSDTPQTNQPSIHSELETVPTQTHTERTDVITHEIDRLLHHIHELDHVRGQESHEIAENVRIIRDELYDLSEYVRTHLVETERVVVMEPERPEPPAVFRRDQSVTAMSVVSERRDRSVDVMSVASEPRVTPAGPRSHPGLRPMLLSPPPTRALSVSSRSSVSSFLSSHHSNDFSLLGLDEVEVEMAPSSPAWQSEPSSPSSDLTPSIISSSESSPGPTLSLTSSSSSPTPPPSSPTPSTESTDSSETARQVWEQTMALWEVDWLNHIKTLIETLINSQQEIPQRDRRDRQGALEETETIHVTDTTQRVTRHRAEDSVSELEDFQTDVESLLSRWRDMARGRDRDHIPIQVPVLHRAGPSLDEQLMELLNVPPAPVPSDIQPPPQLIPFVYQPAPRPSRSRSTSPVLRRDSAPPFREPFWTPETLHQPPLQPRPRARPPLRHPPRPEPPQGTVPVIPEPIRHRTRTPRPEHDMHDAPPSHREPTPGPERRPSVRPPGPFLPESLYDDQRRPPTAPAHLGGGDPPPGSTSWYSRRRPEGVVPPPGAIDGQPRQPGAPAQGPGYVPMPPGPTVVQVPLFDTLMAILREHRLAQLATVDQQRELMRYMGGLNDWLARDVQDRQAELRAVTARVDQLREDLGHLGVGAGPGIPMPQAQAGQPPAFGQGVGGFIVPPVPPAPGGPVPSVVPYPVGFFPHGGPQPPVIPGMDRSPDHSPVIPDERWGMPDPAQYVGPTGPVLPAGTPYAEYHPTGPSQYVHHIEEPDERVVPSTPTTSASRSPLQVRPGRGPMFVPQSPGHGSRSSTPTQESYHPPYSPGALPIPPGDGPNVIPVDPSVGGHLPHQTIINMPPQFGVPPPGHIIDPGIPVQASPPGIFPGLPVQHSLQGVPAGPIVIHPPMQAPPVPVSESVYVPSRASSRTSTRAPVVIIQSSQDGSPLQVPPSAVGVPPSIHLHDDRVPRSPTIHAFPGVPSSSGPPAEGGRRRIPEVSRTPSPGEYDPRDEGRRRPRRHRDDRRRSYSYSPEDRGYRRRHYSPDYEDYHRHRYGRPYSPSDRGYRRYGDGEYSPDRRRRRYGEYEDDPRDGPRYERRGDRPRGPDDRRPREGEDEGHPEEEEDPGRGAPRRQLSGRSGSHRDPEERAADDGPRPPPSEARSPRRPEFVEGDTAGALPRPPPSPSPAPPRSLPPRSPAPRSPTPRSPTLRSPPPPTIIRVDTRPRHPTDDLAHELSRVPPGERYFPTMPSERGGHGRRPSFSMDDAPEPPRRYPSAASAMGDDRRSPQRMPSRGAAPPSMIAEEDDRRGPERMPSRGAPPPSMLAEEDPRRPPSEMIHHVPAPSQQLPSGLGDFEDALRARQERLDEAERGLDQIAHDAQDAEGRRENEFRDNEDARERIFLDNEERREAETRQRGDELLNELEERIANAPQVPPLPVPPPVQEPDHASIIESIHTATQDAASRHASDILETVRLEREEMARERESLAAERERERAHLDEERRLLEDEREAKIAALEEELARTRTELDNERQLRTTEENESRMAAAERDEALRNQLGDLTNMIQQNQALCEEKRALMEEHWAEKQRWKEERDGQMQELMGMVSRLADEQAAARQREEEQRQANEGKPGIEQVMEELHRQNAEQRELLNALSDSWRADSNRQHEETISAVRATANEQVPYNVQGYLDEFSKALATEVRMLLGEVGKLREERRNIQHELGYLMMMKSKYGPGGEFDPEWKPPMAPGAPPPPPPPPDVPPPHEDMPQPRPAWRTVQPRLSRRSRKRPDVAPAPEPVPEPRQAHSWVTWQPNPALAPTPPSVEPTLLVPDRGSPGLFGPRSPRDSYRG
ncbi:hypothetical protein OG21DRAFT_1482945 [Imleria badia]|nr:hypothetical protein OG21DRAFT_1482945 [Imleria badia]